MNMSHRYRCPPHLPALALGSLAAVLTLAFPCPCLADGNVQVALLDDGTLEILGDRKGNGLAVRPAAESKIKIVGTLWAGESTTVNGLDTAYTVPASDVKRIVVNTGLDTDEVLFSSSDPDEPLMLPSLEVDTGEWRDSVRFFNVAISGDVDINTGAARDFVFLEETWIAGDVAISTGNNVGNFSPNVDRVLFRFAIIVGDVYVSTGQGRDLLQFSATDIAGILAISLGHGDDVLEFDPDFDPLFESETTAQGAILFGDHGDDEIRGISNLVADEIEMRGFETVNP